MGVRYRSVGEQTSNFTIGFMTVSQYLELLVGGFNHLEKYEFVNRKDDIPYMKWKINAMFNTTNQ